MIFKAGGRVEVGCEGKIGEKNINLDQNAVGKGEYVTFWTH